MSDNKFILQLKGQQTPKSVVEIKNDKLVAPFVNVPGSSDSVGGIIQDKDSSVVVARGAQNWKIADGVLVPATNLSGDGSDYTGEYAVSGSGLWVNSVYTFPTTGDPRHPVAEIFNAQTKWVLQLCGKNLLSNNGNTIDFSFIVKIGTTNIMTKNITVRECANFFCRHFVLDFSESAQNIIKAQGGSNLTVQLLCADSSASATIYNGMSVLTALQRRIDGDVVASDTKTFDEVVQDIDDINDEIDQIHEDIEDLEEYVDDTFVRLDGESTMTGPLKMRATFSFQCAIAPFWDGVGFYKLNSDDSVTLIASIETPDGFVPWVTNTYNIGSSLKKWKNLYLAGKLFVSTLNNGGDLTVPANTTGTLATKADVDLAANSGRMITDQGVWYAKMYSATVAPSAADGANYADFSQVDGQGNPIIVIYERQNGAWVQSETITPPAEYDGYVPITSKIWDISEQAGQQGGRILWNHQSKEFTPYPQIISFEDIEITGDSTVIMPQNPGANQIVNKDYVDNHIPTGNFYHPGLFAHEWDDHIRNDVQWLRADTFSWQSSAVYEAAYQHLADDIDGKTLQSETIGGTTIQFYLADDGHKICPASEESNVVAIYTATGVAWYYIIDTVNERFKLPRTQYGVTGLRDTVGNYVEPGLPNITGSIIGSSTRGFASSATGCFTVGALMGTMQTNSPNERGNVYMDASRSSSIYGNSNTVQPPATQMYLYFYVGEFTQTALENTAGLNAELFNDKVDLDAGNLSATGKETVAHQAMPSSNTQAMTVGASGATYTAPADGYVVFTGLATAAGQFVYIGSPTFDNVAFQSSSVGNGEYIVFTLPVSKGQVFIVNYNLGGTKSLNFVYANGAQ